MFARRVLFLAMVGSALSAYDPAPSGATTPFMLVALPDTQYYSKNAPATFSAQTQWIVNQEAAQNIVFVTQLGDIVDDGSSTTQWNNAVAAINILDGKIPYSMNFGNHDLHWDYPSGNGWSNCTTYFGPSRYSSYSWFGGASTTGLDTYQTFSAGGYSFLHINLRYDPDSSDLAWAQGILSAHPSQPTIISTHDYLNVDGTRDSVGNYLWNNLVTNNSQIFMVLNGHYSGENQLISTDNAGKNVIQMVSDYQSYPNNGDGFLRQVIFDPDAGLIRVKTYSPTLGTFECDANSQFAYSVTFGSQITVNGLTAYPICTRDWRAVTGNWSSTGNWSQGSLPENGGTTVLNFSGTSGCVSTNDLAGVFTVNKLNFTNSGVVTLNQSGAATGLKLDGSGPTIAVSGSGAVTITALITIAADTLVNVSAGAGQLSLQASDTITGAGNLTVANSSVRPVLMGNAGGFTGNIHVQAGTLKLSNSGGDALGNSTILTIDRGATFDFNQNAENLGGVAGGGTVLANGISLAFFAAGDRTFSGVISGNGGSVTQSASGTLVFTGANTYSGGTTINAGVLVAAASSSLGSGGVTLNGGTLRVGAQVSCSGSVSVGVSGGTIDTNGFSLTVSGSAGGAGTLAKNGNGLLTIAGGLSGIAGSILVNGGTLRSSVGNIDALSDSVTVTIAAGANVDETYGNGEIFGGLAGGGAFIGRAGYNIELGRNNANTTFSGSIRAGAASSGQATPGTALSNFSKSGTGTTTLTGSASDFEGVVDVNQGVLEIVSLTDRGLSSSIGEGVDSGSDITLGTSTAAGTLRYLGPTAGSNRAIALSGAGTLDVASSGTILTLAGALSGGGRLIKQGSGTLVLADDNSFTGGTFVDAGVLVLTSRANLPDGSPLVVGAGGLLLFDPAAPGAAPQESMATVPESIAPVPEPGTACLLFAALSLFALRHQLTRN